eukprot:scaffold340_cov129-Isochrysis_galbana.AAC.1
MAYLLSSSLNGIRVGKPACDTRTASSTAQHRSCDMATRGHNRNGPRTCWKGRSGGRGVGRRPKRRERAGAGARLVWLDAADKVALRRAEGGDERRDRVAELRTDRHEL